MCVLGFVFFPWENSHYQFGKTIILPVPLMIFSQQMKWGFFLFLQPASVSVESLYLSNSLLTPKYLKPAPWSTKNGSPKPQWMYWKPWSAMQLFQLNITSSWPWNRRSQSSFGNDTLWPAVCCSTLSLINDQKWWLKQASKREYFA